jgi:hypothetical protein
MMPLIEFIATFCAGVFFGAALYISMAQHPAALKAGPAVGGRFFPPMYQRAAPLQISLAVIGSLAGFAAWLLGSGVPWLLGSLFLVSVIPITLLAIKPINDVLLDPNHDPDASDTEDLLRRWGPRHWLRSIVSGVAFVLFLLQYSSGR